MIITNRSLFLIVLMMFLSLINIFLVFNHIFLFLCFLCFFVLLMDFLIFLFVKVKLSNNSICNILYLNNAVNYYLNLSSIHYIPYDIEVRFRIYKEFQIDNISFQLNFKQKHYRILSKITFIQIGIVTLPVIDYIYFSPLKFWKKYNVFYNDQTVQVLPFKKENLLLKKIFLPEIFILSCTDEMPNKFYAPVYKALTLILDNYISSNQFVSFLQMNINWSVYFKPTNKISDIKQIKDFCMQQSLNKEKIEIKKYFFNLKCSHIILLVDNVINQSLLLEIIKSKKKVVAVCFIYQNLQKSNDEISALLNLQRIHHVANLQKQITELPKFFKILIFKDSDSVASIYNKIIESIQK